MDPLEKELTKCENSRLSFIESIHDNKWKKEPLSRPLAPAYAVFGYSRTLYS